MAELRIALPDGSMKDVVMDLMERAGLPVSSNGRRIQSGSVDSVLIGNVIFMRPQEIPYYLAHHCFDAAIVGEDWVANWSLPGITTVLRLPLSRQTNKPVRLISAVRQSCPIKSFAELPPRAHVATEYVELVRRWLDETLDRKDIRVIRSYGGTEHKLALGGNQAIDGIVDITDTGSSLIANDLRIVDHIMTSATTISANRAALADPEKGLLIYSFARVIKGAHDAKRFVRIEANVPTTKLKAACAALGGLKGTTRSPLSIKGWYAIAAYVDRAEQGTVILALTRLGVEDIVVSEGQMVILREAT